MNKSEVLKKFKQATKIKRVVLDFKSNDKLKEEFKHNVINSNDITEETFNKHFTEDKISLNCLNLFVMKNPIKTKEETINKLPYDIIGKNIIEYNDNFIKTNFAIYSL